LGNNIGSLASGVDSTQPTRKTAQDGGSAVKQVHGALRDNSGVNPDGLGVRPMSGFQAASIEDQFVDAVRSALETGPDWSAEPVTILRRTVQGHIEMVKFDDSSYMSRAAYDLTANDLTVALSNGEFLKVARIPLEYWDGLLAAPSKGRFFERCIQPRFNVKKLGWLRRMYVQLKSRRRIP
jgi:hypothetical protein